MFLYTIGLKLKFQSNFDIYVKEVGYGKIQMNIVKNYLLKGNNGFVFIR